MYSSIEGQDKVLEVSRKRWWCRLRDNLGHCATEAQKVVSTFICRIHEGYEIHFVALGSSFFFFFLTLYPDNLMQCCWSVDEDNTCSLFQLFSAFNTCGTNLTVVQPMFPHKHPKDSVPFYYKEYEKATLARYFLLTRPWSLFGRIVCPCDLGEDPNVACIPLLTLSTTTCMFSSHLPNRLRSRVSSPCLERVYIMYSCPHPKPDWNVDYHGFEL